MGCGVGDPPCTNIIIINHVSLVIFSVGDPRHFGMDPDPDPLLTDLARDPAISSVTFKMATENYFLFFCLLGYYYFLFFVY